MIIGLILITAVTIASIYCYTNNKINHLLLVMIVAFLAMKLLLFKLGFAFAPTSNNFLYLIILALLCIYVYNNKLQITNRFVDLGIYLCVLLSYILLVDVTRLINPIDHVMLVIHYFWGILFFVLIISSGKHKYVNAEKFDKAILIIVGLYSILGILQYSNLSISEFFLILEYEWGGEQKRTIQRDFEGTNLLTGTMFRMANFGNVLTLLINYLIAKFFLKKLRVNGLLFFLIIIAGCTVIVLTGIRTSLATLLFGIGLNFWFFRKKATYMLAILFIPVILYFIPVLITLGTVSIGAEVQTENSWLRAAGLFYIFSGQADLTNVTLVRSINILEIVKQNPLFGVGMYYEGGYKGIDSPTDAWLLFHVAELGLIGLSLLLLPYFLVIRMLKKQHKVYYKLGIVILSVLLLQTITDNGIFYLVANMIFWVLLAVCVSDKKKPFEGNEAFSYNTGI